MHMPIITNDGVYFTASAFVLAVFVVAVIEVLRHVLGFDK